MAKRGRCLRNLYHYRLYIILITLAMMLMLLYLYSHASNPQFSNRLTLGFIENPDIDEASGLAASRKNKGVLWTHNDSGNRNSIFALNLRGQNLGEYQIGFIPNRDWEDIAVGPGPDEQHQYIYIGDIGDNDAEYYIKYIYRIPEPSVDSSQSPVDTILSDFDVIAFRYPDGERDAETLMVDPLTKDIYIVSKREDSVRVYRASNPQAMSDKVTVLEYITALNLSHITAGDISASGSEILLKSYSNVYYWKREKSQSIGEALEMMPQMVPYIAEPQGEGITWAPDASGYYTISEEPAGVPAFLYFYPRMRSKEYLMK
jgi:hypothetical protein